MLVWTLRERARDPEALNRHWLGHEQRLLLEGAGALDQAVGREAQGRLGRRRRVVVRGRQWRGLGLGRWLRAGAGGLGLGVHGERWGGG